MGKSWKIIGLAVLSVTLLLQVACGNSNNGREQGGNKAADSEQTTTAGKK